MPVSALKSMGPVTPATRKIATEVLAATEAAGHQIHTIWGYSVTSRPEHSSGRALDFMCSTPAGNFIADYLWTHRGRLGLNWELWRQRIRSTSPGKPGTWQPMANRGNTTANHYDHVHCFFDGRDPGTPAVKVPSAPAPPPAMPDSLRADADRPWWGNRPFPQEPGWLSVGQLRAAMEHDGPRADQGLYMFADQVWAVQRMLGELGWLRFGAFVAGHYGLYTKGNPGNPDDGGMAGFQVKRGGTGDGWAGESELRKLCEMAGRNYAVKP